MRVYIELEDPHDGVSYHAGRPLQGRVEVVMGARARKVTPTVLSLVLKGKEKTKKAVRRFFSVTLPLTNNRPIDIHENSTYNFPFSIPLPGSLPSSTRYFTDPEHARSGCRPKFEIEYSASVRASVWGAQGRRTRRLFNIVSAPLPDERVLGMIQPQVFQVSAEGALQKLLSSSSSLAKSKGRVYVAASLTDTHVGRGDTLDLFLACRNDSTTEIQRVSAKIIEHAYWGTSSSSMKHDQATTLLELPDIDLPGLSKQKCSKARITGTDYYEKRFQAEQYRILLDALQQPGNAVRLQIPAHARDSYAGQLLKVVHYLEVRLQTPRRITNPAVRVPLRIGSPPHRRHDSAWPAPGARTGSEIPIVEAVVALPPSGGEQNGRRASIDADVIYAQADVIVLGGDAVVENDGAVSDGDDDGDDEEMEDVEERAPLPMPSAPPAYYDGADDNNDTTAFPPPSAPNACRDPPELVPEEPTTSLELLFQQMVSSINDFQILENKLRHPEWVRLFQNITPEDYGTIILHVNVETDQPRVAALLAPTLNGGHGLNCRYAAQAIRNAANWTRCAMVTRLLPLCGRDTAHTASVALMRAELNEWEIMVTQRNFHDAIASARRPLEP